MTWAIADCPSWIAVKGDVVDEEGESVEGVTLGVTRHRASPFAASPDMTIRGPAKTRIVDGAFDVTVAGSHAITLSFEKESYKSEKFYISRGNECDFYGAFDYSQLDMQPDGRAKIVLRKKEIDGNRELIPAEAGAI